MSNVHSKEFTGSPHSNWAARTNFCLGERVDGRTAGAAMSTRAPFTSQVLQIGPSKSLPAGTDTGPVPPTTDPAPPRVPPTGRFPLAAVRFQIARALPPTDQWADVPPRTPSRPTLANDEDDSAEISRVD